jgi:hypothetical protein
MTFAPGRQGGEPWWIRLRKFKTLSCRASPIREDGGNEKATR